MDASETSPTRIGDRYRLDERIGAGAMGAVWRGTDELLSRPVALKELLAAAARGGGAEGAEEARQRLMREGRIGARLQHPHVISMFDVVVHEERPWLVMEYLPSQSLAQVLSIKGPMEPLVAADVGRQVADGLAAAHAAGVVHRDVKPGNVLLAEDGRVKITDFGVSRAVDDVQLTRTGLIAGTPAFLAPEIARGHEPTAASDVFALGSTLYTAVEGAPPFGLDDNAYALLHKVATGEIIPPRQAGVLEPVLLQLLATDPLDRPTASQARDILAMVAAGQAPAPAPAPPPPPPRRSSLLAALVGGGRNGGRSGGRSGTDRSGTGRPAADSPSAGRASAGAALVGGAAAGVAGAAAGARAAAPPVGAATNSTPAPTDAVGPDVATPVGVPGAGAAAPVAPPADVPAPDAAAPASAAPAVDVPATDGSGPPDTDAPAPVADAPEPGASSAAPAGAAPAGAAPAGAAGAVAAGAVAAGAVADGAAPYRGPGATAVAAGGATPAGTAGGDPTPPGSAPGAAGGRPRRRWPIVLVAALLALLVIGGAFAAALNGGGGDPSAPGAATGTSAAPDPTTDPPAATATEPAAEPAPATEASPSPAPEPSAAAPTAEPAAPVAPPVPTTVEPVTFIRNYYDLLPGDTDAGWNLLSDRARELSRSRSFYEEFYGRYSEVYAENLNAQGNTVTATIVFVRPDGTIDSRDRYTFEVGTEGGRQVMTSFFQGG